MLRFESDDILGAIQINEVASGYYWVACDATYSGPRSVCGDVDRGRLGALWVQLVVRGGMIGIRFVLGGAAWLA